jgi:hypothetical protein
MSTTRDTGFLRNAVQVTNQGIDFVSGSTLLMSISSSGAVTTTGVISGSNALSASYSISGSYAVSSSYAYTASSAINSTTASYVLNAVSSSYAYTASSATNATSASKAVSASYSDTASFSNNFTVLGNLTVYGTQSVQYITSSQLNISSNIITVNVGTPAIRFGGLSVYDSGSTAGATGSLFWDSQNNRWIYQQETGSTYSGGMLMSGPRNFGGLGNEEGTTNNSLMKGQGGDHITSSAIFEDGYKATIYTNSLVVSSSGLVGIGTTNPINTLDVSGTGRFTSTVSSTTSTTGATIKLGGFTNYGTIQDANDVRRIWFENVGSYRTIFDLPVSGTSFAFRTNDGTSLFNLTSGSVSTFSGDLSVATAGTTAVLFDGTNPTLTLSRNNNGNASAAINFKGSSAVKWQIGTNQSTGLGLEINEGDATANRFYMAPGGAVTFSSTGVFSSNVNVLRANIGGAANDADISLNVSAPSGTGKYIMFGRNSSHTAVMAIDSDGNIGCVSYNVNNAMNLGGQVLGTVSTSWVSTNLTTLYVGFVFIYWADANSGERNTAVITCNYYPSGVTVISSSNNGGKGMQFQMNGSTLQLKTTTGTAAGVQLVWFKI